MLRYAFIFTICVVCRGIPHPPNMTPMGTAAIASGIIFSFPRAAFLILVTMGIGDIMLAWRHGYSIGSFGPWVYRQAPHEQDPWFAPLFFSGIRKNGGYFHK